MTDAKITSSLWLMWWTFGFSLLSSVDLGEELPLGIIWLLKMITIRVSYLKNVCNSYACNRECLRLDWPQGQLLRSSSIISATIYRSMLSLENDCIAIRKWNIVALRPNWKTSWRSLKGKYVTKLVRGSTQWQHSCQTTSCVFVGNIQINSLVNCAPNCGMN